MTLHRTTDAGRTALREDEPEKVLDLASAAYTKLYAATVSDIMPARGPTIAGVRHRLSPARLQLLQPRFRGCSGSCSSGTYVQRMY